ncbi:MAG TPA: hypothetical protein VG389_22980 [Myxococcota bacterium]|jgi:uncharacterized protein YneF (UPF0154 family)|nr:hypothetical protein [Myxococcota bacterium]
MPTTLHVVYIPGIFLLGLWLGYFLAVRQLKARGAARRNADDDLRDYDG